MTVEEDRGAGAQVLQDWEASAELVDKKVVGLEFIQFAGDPDLEEEEKLSCNGTNDHEAGEDRRWEGIAADADVECAYSGRCISLGMSVCKNKSRITISGLLKTMTFVTVACEDDDSVASVLQTYSSINDQSLRTSNAKIRVEENNGLLLVLICDLFKGIVSHLASEMAHTIRILRV